MTVEQRLVDDFPFFAENQLKIRDKTGKLVPFKLNKAQTYLQKRVNEQLRLKGKIRLAILKGRQQGLSTFIGGFLYHKTICNEGALTFIFAHDSDGSSSLYQMVKTFYAEGVYDDLKPRVGASSQKEMSFPNIRSSYKVGTAGTVGLGRSKTIQQLHWSEVAYSPNCEEHAKGIMQAVPDMPNTAVFLESTSNGQGDFFHRTCMQALSGEGDFELVFIPWYWQEEYTRPKPDDWQMLPEEQALYDSFHRDGLTEEHLVWRRHKIFTDFHAQVSQFKREYPFTPEEAFEADDEDSFIKAASVRRARDADQVPTDAPMIFGVDPARLGGDRFRICHRKGRNILALYALPISDMEDSIRRLQEAMEQYKPAIVNIDCGGLGVAVYDRLRALGYANQVKKVDFGGSASNADRYRNKRAEMYATAREWLLDEPCSIRLDAKTGDMLQSELSVVKAKWINNSQMIMIPKEEIKKELGYSPDSADAFCFVGNTLINTPEGKKPIDSLKVGDFVSTPLGKTRIAKVWVSESETLTTAEFSNGSKLTGKGEHKIFDWNTGHCRLDALSLTNDNETAKGHLKWLPLKVLCIMARDLEFKPLVDTISQGERIAVKDFYTAAFGQILTGIYQKAITSITLMGTGAITIYQTLGLSKQANTNASTFLSALPMARCSHHPKMHLEKQHYGTQAMKAEHGTVSMGSVLGKQGRPLPRVVKHVDAAMKPIIRTSRSIAHPLVVKVLAIGDTSIAKGIASSAVKLLRLIGIEPRRVAPVHVQTNTERKTVYNLTLERHNVYYANDILVYNCLTFAQPIAKTATQAGMQYMSQPITRDIQWNVI